MFKSVIHRYIFLLGIITVIAGLSLSPFLLSLGQFILGGNWLLEFNYRQKVQLSKRNKGLVWFAMIYFIHVLWILNTENFNYALHDLKIKLPLLSLPILFGTTQPLNKKELSFIVHCFLLSILISTTISAYIFFGFTELPSHDAREASIFISHIRFAMLVVLAACFVIWLVLDSNSPRLPILLIYGISLIWFVCFIFIFSALTGVVLFTFTTPIAIIYWIRKQESKLLQIAGLTATIGFIIVISVYILLSYYEYNNRNTVNIELLAEKTVNGNMYEHDDRYIYENKDLVWIYICPIELHREWKRKSAIPLNSFDKKGQAIRHTLIRYLTSLGYRKDSVGISNLTKVDIEMIENGYSNHIFKKKYSLAPRLYQIFWEIEAYKVRGEVNGHSLTQRIEYFNNALNTIKRHFWFGTGTGDINDEIMLQYEIDKSVLLPELRFRAHNQFISFMVAFGFCGFLSIMFFLNFGIYSKKENIDLICIFFMLISFLSMLTEDTLETQAGVSIVSFFMYLLFFGRIVNLKNNDKG